MVPVAPIITGITLVFTFHMRCISIVRSLYFKIFSASFLITHYCCCYYCYYYYYYYYYYYWRSEVEGDETGVMACMGEVRNVDFWVRKYERKCQLEDDGFRWEGGIWNVC